MVSDISSKLSPDNVQLSVGLATGSPTGTLANKTLDKSQAGITPIPKSDIRFDFERDSQVLKEAIGKLNEMLVSNARNVSFSLDEKLGRPIVYVKNASTGEIIRQIPNEVIVRIAHSIEDFKGMLHNEKI